MWYCSLCDLDLGEISVDNNQNNHPTCPYCHGAVEEDHKLKEMDLKESNIQEEIGAWLLDEDEVENNPTMNYYQIDAFDKMAELLVDHVFDIIAISLDESPYREYRDDIVHIMKEAFKPQAKIAYTEIAKIITENYRSVDAKLDRFN